MNGGDSVNFAIRFLVLSLYCLQSTKLKKKVFEFIVIC
jgi:hypothetical protein